MNPASGSLKKTGRLALSIAAIGIVYGDIGTSPLYALKTSFDPARGLFLSPDNILGILSTLIWSITLVVCVKYLAFVVRADNKGEGGILSLISLVGSHLKNKSGRAFAALSVVGIIGAALLYSDGILTPAVTVLSAVEGLKVISPDFEHYVVPIALVILIGLFLFQSRGTAKVGRLFGPIMVLWFTVLGALGTANILHNPQVLLAFNPLYAVQFFQANGGLALIILGSVFLAMTGAEVLYADLGHFGRGPIRRSWFFVVFPALILNYLGQGAFLLTPGNTAANLFFDLAPDWFQYPLVVLATLAAIIASQAVITGAFSLARQSVQLGYWPRMQINHTSSETQGQVYVPLINWLLMLGTIALVVGFQQSDNLANAYGIAVSADMLITSCLMVFVARRIWKVSWWILAPVASVFFLLDTAFFAANSGKLFLGGWVVVLIAVVIFALMKTWRDGRNRLRLGIESAALTMDTFAASIDFDPPARVKGTAVFLAGNPKGVPRALIQNLRHNRILHEQTIVVSVQTVEYPFVSDDQRARIISHGAGIWMAVIQFGFSESPDIPAAMRLLHADGLAINPHLTTFFLGRESLIINHKKRTMMLWRKKLFHFMSHNALDATNFFKLPPNQVVEIGTQIEL